MRIRLLSMMAVGLGLAVQMTAAAHADTRVALVIGNGAYASPLMPRLPNPPRDAAAIGNTLKDLGFDVDVVTDATKETMEDALSRLARKARDADVTLLFFAGHALQDQGKNYLAPVDATLSDETDLRHRFVRLDDVLDDLAGAKGARILLLDACRDNQAVEALRSSLPKSRSAGLSRGLARIPEAEGQLVAFATQPDRVAADGVGADSPFTTALVAHLGEPGVELRIALTRVRVDVAKATHNDQIPEVSDSLLGEVYLKLATAAPTASETAAGPVSAANPDVVFWQSIENSKTKADFQAYLEKFPDGVFARLARTRLAALEPAVGPPAPATAAAGPITLSGHTDWIRTAVFSPDNSRIVTASYDKTARIWDATSGRLLATLEGEAGFSAAAFSPDGTRIVTASGDKTAKIWDAASYRLLATLEGHTDALYSAAFSADGSRIVTASGDGIVKIWDAASDHLLTTLNASPTSELVSYSGYSAAFSPDGTRVVTTSWDKTASIWDATSGRLLTTLKGHTGVVSTAVFSSDGSRIVTASSDKTAKVWDVASGGLLATLKGHTDTLLAAAFSPDASRIVTASSDKTVKIWDVSSGRLLTTLEGDAGFSAASFSPDGSRIVTASDDKTAKIWDIQGLINERRLTLEPGVLPAVPAIAAAEPITLTGHTDTLYSAAFSPDGSRIVTASGDKTAKIWDASSGRLLATLKGHTGQVRSAMFSPDGSRIVTASSDKTAKVWDAAAGRLLTTLKGHSDEVGSAAFSPDGHRIVTASNDETAQIWDAASGRHLATLQGHNDLLYSATFSPDGHRIVTASRDLTAKIWDATSGRVLVTLKGHTAEVDSAVFSPDGSRILTGSGDNTDKIWDATSGRLLSTLQNSSWVLSAAYSPDGSRIVTAAANYKPPKSGTPARAVTSPPWRATATWSIRPPSRLTVAASSRRART